MDAMPPRPPAPTRSPRTWIGAGVENTAASDGSVTASAIRVGDMGGRGGAPPNR